MADLEKIRDNRRDTRLETSASLTYYPFSSRKEPSRVARILNCSPGGISFLASRTLKPRQTICLHTQPISEPRAATHRAGAMLKSFSLGEVRWCIKAAGGEEGYRIGVRYLQPLEPADTPSASSGKHAPGDRGQKTF
jgi:hypothetical protein